MKHDHLSSRLTQKVEILRISGDASLGGFVWAKNGRCWADIELDVKNNLFSSVGIGARGATVTMRPRLGLDLRHALRWNDQFLFLTSIILSPDRDRLELKAALCDPVTLTARPQARTGRNELDRPVVSQLPSFTFPGILTELYRQNAQDEIYRAETLRRVLVTPKAVALRPGDLVQPGTGAPYTVRQALDLDQWKNEYVIERQEDI